MVVLDMESFLVHGLTFVHLADYAHSAIPHSPPSPKIAHFASSLTAGLGLSRSELFDFTLPINI